MSAKSKNFALTELAACVVVLIYLLGTSHRSTVSTSEIETEPSADATKHTTPADSANRLRIYEVGDIESAIAKQYSGGYWKIKQGCFVFSTEFRYGQMPANPPSNSTTTITFRPVDPVNDADKLIVSSVHSNTGRPSSPGYVVGGRLIAVETDDGHRETLVNLDAFRQQLGLTFLRKPGQIQQ